MWQDDGFSALRAATAYALVAAVGHDDSNLDLVGTYALICPGVMRDAFVWLFIFR